MGLASLVVLLISGLISSYGFLTFSGGIEMGKSVDCFLYGWNISLKWFKKKDCNYFSNKLI